MSASRPRSAWRRGGCSTLALVLVVGTGWVFGSTWLVQWIEAPWSFEALGPTLTGTWDGPLQARRGVEYRLFLDIGYEAPDEYSSTNLRGTGRICLRNGETFELTLRGEGNRAGDRVTVSLAHADDTRPGPIMTLNGAWSGETLALQATSNPFLPDGTFQAVRTISTDDPDDSFHPAELRRADRTTFEAACRRLAS